MHEGRITNIHSAPSLPEYVGEKGVELGLTDQLTSVVSTITPEGEALQTTLRKLQHAMGRGAQLSRCWRKSPERIQSHFHFSICLTFCGAKPFLTRKTLLVSLVSS